MAAISKPVSSKGGQAGQAAIFVPVFHPATITYAEAWTQFIFTPGCEFSQRGSADMAKEILTRYFNHMRVRLQGGKPQYKGYMSKTGISA